MMTPDSSRYWPREKFRPGTAPPSFDKQYVRDFMDSTGWDHEPPAPHVPADVIANTRAKYVEAYELLTDYGLLRLVRKRRLSHHMAPSASPGGRSSARPRSDGR